MVDLLPVTYELGAQPIEPLTIRHHVVPVLIQQEKNESRCFVLITR